MSIRHNLMAFQRDTAVLVWNVPIQNANVLEVGLTVVARG